MIINRNEKLVLETMRGHILKPEEGWLPFGEIHKNVLAKLGMTSLEEQLNFYRAISAAGECQCIRLGGTSFLTGIPWSQFELNSEN